MTGIVGADTDAGVVLTVRGKLCRALGHRTDTPCAGELEVLVDDVLHRWALAQSQHQIVVEKLEQLEAMQGTAGTVHGCPMPGGVVTPCCGRTPFEVLRTDRITVDAALVTCHRPGAPR